MTAKAPGRNASRRASLALAARGGRSGLQSLQTVADSSRTSLPKEAPRGLAGVPDALWAELEFVLEHLFDPANNDHLSLDDQLARVVQKDLYAAKFYKLAMGVFGQQRAALEMGSNQKRKRVIEARPKEFYRGGIEEVEEESWNAALRPNPPKPDLLSAERLAEIRRQDEIAEYKRWFAEKKAFRQQLDTFGDVARFLDGKPDKTEEEKTRFKEVQEERAKMREKKIEHSPERPSSSKNKKKPGVKRPSPLALGIIDAALKKRKMRLLDLFASVDKDKSWTLSREELQKAFDRTGIHMPPALLEDLIITLDKDNNNELDYRELSMGIEQFRIERRRTDLSVASTLERELSQLSTAGPLSNEKTLETTREESERQEDQDRKCDNLSPPPLDVRDERFVCDNAEAAVDLRKRDRVALKHFREKSEDYVASHRSMVRSGDRGFDAHNAPSSLGGDTGSSVEKYRRVVFRDYMSLMRMCQEEKVVLSEELLRRVLLFPADRPPSAIRGKIRQPGARCPVSKAQVLFDRREAARGARRAAREAQEAAERRARRRRAVNLSQVGAALPTAEELAEERDEERVHLSTGWATIKSKVDCWLTFEEFEQLICNLPLTQHADIRLPPDNAFWPGTALNRLRLFVEDRQFGPGSVFQPTAPPLRTTPGARRANWGFDNDLRTAPVARASDGRFFVTSGDIDPQLRSQVLLPKS